MTELAKSELTDDRVDVLKIEKTSRGTVPVTVSFKPTVVQDSETASLEQSLRPLTFRELHIRKRHQKQHSRLAALATDAVLLPIGSEEFLTPGKVDPKMGPEAAFLHISQLAGPTRGVNDLYLFNVVVALEWLPSAQTIELLMHAFRSVSDTLYDATNGSMVIGRVTFAGPEYMQAADIQIMASNRFHPRSSVDGLHMEEKFSPIRLGRGIWLKKSHTLLPWTEPFAYRAIAHEWAHYALGLHDEYLDDTKKVARHATDHHVLVEDASWGQPIVVPRIRLSVETLMETLDSSELVPFQHEGDRVGKAVYDRIIQGVRERFAEAEPALMRADPGPYRFPGSLPQCYTLGTPSAPPSPEEREVGLGDLALKHAWLYLLARNSEGALSNIITQGAVDQRTLGVEIGDSRIAARPFQLLGAGERTELLAVGLAGEASKPEGFAVRTAPVPAANGPVEWRAVSPAGDSVATADGDKVYDAPVVSVIPRSEKPALSDLEVDVRVVGAAGTPTVWLSETGRSGLTTLDPQGLGLYGAAGGGHQAITGLDGIVLLELGEKDRHFWVAEYSHGGNPPTTVRSPGAPISAGSSDGNLMIFTRMEEPPDPPRDDDYKHQIVTTRNFAGFEAGRPGQPASYLFSVASRHSLKDDLARLRPTIVLYYDDGALQRDKELALFRYDEGQRRWLRLPAYIPPGAFYVATPINAETAPSFVADSVPDELRLEHYRLFLV